jgi:hypothetical protein
MASVFNGIFVICAIALTNSASRQRNTEQVSRTGRFDLPCSAETAFPLFSPEGEKLWIKDWDPRPVFPDTIEFRRDTVFREGQADEEAVWTILDADWQTHRAEYVRLAPTSHIAHIVVKIEALGPERCKVAVSYTVTSFGEHAANILAAFSEEAYAAKMHDWQQKISAYLENRKSNSVASPTPTQ